MFILGTEQENFLFLSDHFFFFGFSGKCFNIVEEKVYGFKNVLDNESNFPFSPTTFQI